VELFDTSGNHSYLPEWANEAVFYQIFPLGYFGAPTVNDGKALMVPRLKQIRSHYKHFTDLGIDAVYFSPLFESGTHGYDTNDYMAIDRRLGDVALFKEIVAELHELNIKVVLDGVFNHTGQRHFAFADLCAKGPAASEYANWYHVGARGYDFEGWITTDAVKGTGFSFDCWEGHAMLPRLNLAEPAVKQHIFDVAKFWIQEVGIDGWRLDVAHEISPDFWREFRSACDSVDPNCLLVGEMIHGNYNGWVGNDRLHSGTNYQMSHATWFSLNDHNYEYFYTALLREESLFKGLTLVNFVGNHDVLRIASNLTEPAHYLHCMVALCLMKGIPSLYYGDEFGMEGTPADGTDEHSGGDDAMRRPMPDCADTTLWPAIGQSRLALTQKLLKIRRDHPVFGNAGTQDIENITLISNEQIVIMRESDDEVGVLVFNCGDYEVNPWPEVQLPETCAAYAKGTEFVDLLMPAGEGELLVNDGGVIYAGPCLANSVKVLVWKKPAPPPGTLPTIRNVSAGVAGVAGAAADPYDAYASPPAAPAAPAPLPPAAFDPVAYAAAPAYDPAAAAAEAAAAAADPFAWADAYAAANPAVAAAAAAASAAAAAGLYLNPKP